MAATWAPNHSIGIPTVLIQSSYGAHITMLYISFVLFFGLPNI